MAADNYWTYTDGYAMRLTYEIAIGATNGDEYSTCIASDDKLAMTCWNATIG